MIDSEFFGMAFWALVAIAIFLYASQPREIDGRDPVEWLGDGLRQWGIRWFRSVPRDRALRRMSTPASASGDVEGGQGAGGACDDAGANYRLFPARR